MMGAGPGNSGTPGPAAADRLDGRQQGDEQGHRRRVGDRHENRLPVASPPRQGRRNWHRQGCSSWGGARASGRAASAAEILRETTTEKPQGETHWSTRTLAAELGTSLSMFQRVWKTNGSQSHRLKTFKFSNDPRFAEKPVDVVGLYLNPPEHAIVPCVDEKSQIQAPDRIACR